MKLAPLLIALLLLLVAAVPASAQKGKDVKPADGSVHEAILKGLELIRDGKFDAWIDRYCHKGDLCFNDNSKAGLKRYNLPAMKRQAAHCIKDGGVLRVTRTDGDPAKVDEVKIFAVCNPKGMPRPFTMKKEDKSWKFKKI